MSAKQQSACLKETEAPSPHQKTPKGSGLRTLEDQSTLSTGTRLSGLPQELLQAIVHILQIRKSQIKDLDLPEVQGDEP